MSDSTKIKAKHLPRSLTKDTKVISSMKAIQRAGFWAFLIAVFLPLMLGFLIALGKTPHSTLYVLPIAAYFAYSGWKMNKLRGGRSITILLVVNILLGLLMIFSILPLIMIITSIIALSKMGTYKKWQNGEQPEATQIHTKAKERKSKGLIITAIICGTLVVASVMGGFVYMQHQNAVQKDKEFQQRKQLLEYEQKQLNNRSSDTNDAKRDAARSECEATGRSWFQC